MRDEAHPAILDTYWEAVRDRDVERIAGLFTDDFIEDWPQSGERVRGFEGWRQVVDGHPTYPAATVRRILGGGDVWVCEVDFDYGGETGLWRICSVFELMDGRIARVTQYFGAPFEAAEWRVGITEPLDQSG